jgi:hypothetical protein
MDCTQIQNNDDSYIQCNDPRISGSSFCRELTEDIFDIGVFDDQGNPIQQVEGSPTGTTINLEPGTYTVNEIRDPTGTNPNQLLINPDLVTNCNNQKDFPDGGEIIIRDDARGVGISYPLCIEYEEEQNIDCSTITLAAGEERTCIVKNYIDGATDTNPRG